MEETKKSNTGLVIAIIAAVLLAAAAVYLFFDSRGKGRALHLHVQAEDEQRIESHIQYCARHKADHGKKGIALKAQLVIEHEGHAHKRRAAEDDDHIIRREGNGLG